MAGTSRFAAGFPSATFVDAIKQTMKMGIPEDEDERLTWHWAAETDDVVSPTGAPYEWDQGPGDPVVTTPSRSVQVDYALEFATRSTANDTLLLGTFNDPTATVTLVDSDYQQIKDADYCTIGTSRYEILFHGPVVAMFDADIHTVYIQAHDEA